MRSKLYLVLCFLIVGLTATVFAGEPQRLGADKPAPKLLEKVNPVYPAEAKEKRIQGPVVLEALINEKGEVVDVKAESDKAMLEKEKVTEPFDPLLTKAAIDAVKQWKYEPYKDASGKVQPVRFSVVIRFKLM